MTDCDELAQAIEKHLRGAAGPEEDARVRAHLQACAPCEDFVQRARRIEAELLARLDAPTRAADERWSAIQQRLRAERHGMIAMLFAALGCLGLAPAIALDGSDPSNRWLGLAMGAVGGFMLAAWPWARRRLRASAADPDALLAWSRKRARSEVLGLAIAVLWIGGTDTFIGALLLRGTASPLRDGALLMLAAGGAAFLGAIAARARTLARELRVLS